jgi:hypothetical protein
MLRLSTAALFDVLGIDPKQISASSLRPGGAMAMLSAGIDTDIIEMTGRWHGEAMFRYLHLQCYPLMKDLSHKMVAYGDFSLLPGEDISAEAKVYLDLAKELQAKLDLASSSA